jgi:hypothetical protein
MINSGSAGIVKVDSGRGFVVESKDWRRHRLVIPVPGEFIKSSRNRRLVQPATVLLPAIRSEAYP